MTNLEALKQLILITCSSHIDEPETLILSKISQHFGLSENELYECLREADCMDDSEISEALSCYQ